MLLPHFTLKHRAKTPAGIEITQNFLKRNFTHKYQVELKNRKIDMNHITKKQFERLLQLN